MIINFLKRVFSSLLLKIIVAFVLFMLALASTATGWMILDWYVFEPFVTRLDATLYVLSCLAFLIAAARQIFRELMQERLHEYDGPAAIPAYIDVSGAQVINYLPYRWPPESLSPYLPVHWPEFDSV